MQPISEFMAGEIFVISERIGDDRNSPMEVRETYYMRDCDDACRFPYNVRAARLATIQGVPGEVPRYQRVLPEPCRDPGDIDGRIKAQRYHPGHVWGIDATPAIEVAFNQGPR